MAQQQDRSLSENARALALINMSMNDSLVASFFNKYHYNFWRPETAIHAGDTDGNPKTDPDPNYVPFITTPCFPSYPSNHGSAGNGGAEVARRLYGEGGHAITLSNPAVPTIVLQYTTFKQITDDISDARVYGGIHFRTDQEAGADLGRAIGTAVYKNNLRPMHDERLIKLAPDNNSPFSCPAAWEFLRAVGARRANSTLRMQTHVCWACPHTPTGYRYRKSTKCGGPPKGGFA